MKSVPEDGSLTVRFMTEPDQWVMYYEHYDAVRKFYPCSDDCPGCDEGDRPSQKYAANVVDVDEGKVVPLKMTKTLAASVLKRFDKYKTLLDRDYELTRTGTGRDTEYDSIPESPTKMNISRYEEIDLWALVEAQLPSEEDDDDDDDEEETPRARRKGGSTRATKTTRRKVVEDDDDDDDDDIDDDEDEKPRRRPVKKSASSTTRKPVRKVGAAKKAPARRSMSRR